LQQIRPDNVKKEYYLTDALHIIIHSGKKAIAITAVHPEDVFSINSRRQLADVSKVMQARIQENLMCNGVTIVDPPNTWVDARAAIGKDSVIHPFTYIHGQVRIGRNCQIGPFAYLRDGTVLEDDVVLGVFTEIKNSHLAEQVRARHHTYIGDAEVGKGVNIGAGTIFANYDGKNIMRTKVGEQTFIGSGSILIAPLTLPPGSHIQPGEVRRKDRTNSLGAEDVNGSESGKANEVRR
jgi:bifunctional UDP-N-acetylglucosamine pyrophosphorylase/glucosamine-1-phosphate N-acetyltransferase